MTSEKRWIGRWLLGVAVVHLTFAVVFMSDSFAELWRAGLFNTVNGQPEREFPFWFTFAGLVLLMLAVLIDRLEKLGQPIPSLVGWMLLGMVVFGLVVMPISGVWLLLPPVVGLLARSRAATATLVALVLAPGTLFGAEVGERTLEYRGEQRTYHVFAPEGEGPFPLLFVLHGSGRDGMSVMEPWQNLAAKEGIVVVAPESLDSKVWIAPADGPDLLRDIAERVGTELQIDPRRVYLFGHSGGASFSLQMAVAESEYFAAAAVHAGRLHPESYPMADEAKRKIPMKIIVGTKDRYFPLERVRATRDDLGKRGFTVELTEVKGHTHWYYDRANEFNQQCWEFLSRHSLESDPVWVQYAFE